MLILFFNNIYCTNFITLNKKMKIKVNIVLNGEYSLKIYININSLKHIPSIILF
jgi:hypothetical protein